MQICLNIANHQISCGLFNQSKLVASYQFAMSQYMTADQIGIWLESVCLREKSTPLDIQQIAFASVSFEHNAIIEQMALKYFNLEAFAVKAGVKTGLKILYKNPLELGADRVARAVAVKHQFPDKNAVIVHLDYINTICALSADGSFLGGLIFPGIELSCQSLSSASSRLSAIDYKKQILDISKSTADAIASGITLSVSATIEGAIKMITNNYFAKSKPLVVASGQFAQKISQPNKFDVLQPDLTLHGIYLLLNNSLNRN